MLCFCAITSSIEVGQSMPATVAIHAARISRFFCACADSNVSKQTNMHTTRFKYDKRILIICVSCKREFLCVLQYTAPQVHRTDNHLTAKRKSGEYVNLLTLLRCRFGN